MSTQLVTQLQEWGLSNVPAFNYYGDGENQNQTQPGLRVHGMEAMANCMPLSRAFSQNFGKVWKCNKVFGKKRQCLQNSHNCICGGIMWFDYNTPNVIHNKW